MSNRYRNCGLAFAKVVSRHCDEDSIIAPLIGVATLLVWDALDLLYTMDVHDQADMTRPLGSDIAPDDAVDSLASFPARNIIQEQGQAFKLYLWTRARETFGKSQTGEDVPLPQGRREFPDLSHNLHGKPGQPCKNIIGRIALGELQCDVGSWRGKNN